MRGRIPSSMQPEKGVWKDLLDGWRDEVPLHPQMAPNHSGTGRRRSERQTVMGGDGVCEEEPLNTQV